MNPYAGLGKSISIPDDRKQLPPAPPKRHSTPSEVDFYVIRHDEQLKGLERRVDGLEDVSGSMDSKLDKITETLQQEIQSRALEKVTKDDEKHQEDQKTKRFQLVLSAIPIILAPLIALFTGYMQKPTPDYKSNVVVVSEYTQEAAECKKTAQSKQQFVECVRDAQLKNTPQFER